MNKRSSTIASYRDKTLSKNNRQNVKVTITKRGNSFDTVTVFILTGLTTLAKPIIRRILTAQLPTTLDIVKS